MKPRAALKPAAPTMIAPRPSAPRTVIIRQQPQKSTAILAGWIILLIGYILAAIPLLGFSVYIIAFPVCIASGLLGVFAASGGKPLRGVILILSSIVSFFLLLLVPWLSFVITTWWIGDSPH